MPLKSLNTHEAIPRFPENDDETCALSTEDLEKILCELHADDHARHPGDALRSAIGLIGYN